MKKYILITGCAYYNKGSQAMLFNSVDELKRRYPDKEIIMLSSMDYKKDNSIYAFRVFPDYLARLLPFPMSMVRKIGKIVMGGKTNPDEKLLVKELDEILRDTYMIVDAAGYALSSRWKPEWRNLIYLMKIAVAKKYNIPMYLMQQSFGPFEYTGFIGKIIYHYVKKFMQYPRIVFAREKEGYESVTMIRKGKTMRMDDIVLLNKTIDLSHVYAEKIRFNLQKLEGIQPKVAIIPNMTCIEQATDREALMKLYSKIVDVLLPDYEVYIVKHSNDDEEACKLIKGMFANDERVKLVIEEFNCIEFEYLVKQFDFCVASRFHSIVHSFKNGVPCLVLGWAVKYADLLSSFDQIQYLFDVRDTLDEDKILEKLANLVTEHANESHVILENLNRIQSVDAYDIVDEDVKLFYGEKLC